MTKGKDARLDSRLGRPGKKLGKRHLAKVKAQKADQQELPEALYQEALIFLDHLNTGGTISDPRIGFDLSTAVHDAVKLYIEIYQPRVSRLVPARGSWLAHGLNIKRKSYDGAPIRSGLRLHHGENHFHCLFCRDNLLTFGWNDGVATVSPAIIDKLYTHTHWCAMQFVRRLFEGNDEGYQQAYHPDPDHHRPRGVTARMLELKLYSDRQELAEQLEARMPLDENLKFDPNAEGRNS